MAINAEQLNIILAARDKEFTKAMDRSQKRVASFSKKSQKNLSATGKAFSSMGSAVGALLSALSGAALIKAVKGVVSKLDDIGKTADRIGITTDGLQELRAVAESAGVSQSVLDSSIEKLGKNLAEASTGIGTAKVALKQLNLSANNLIGLGLDGAMDKIADAVNKVENPMERTALATQLFGRSGAPLLNLLREGSEGMAQMRQEARDLGIVIDESLIREAEDAQTQLDLMSRVISANVSSALISLAPLLVSTAEGIAAISTAISDFGFQGDTAGFMPGLDADGLRDLAGQYKGLEQELARVGVAQSNLAANTEKFGAESVAAQTYATELKNAEEALAQAVKVRQRQQSAEAAITTSVENIQSEIAANTELAKVQAMTAKAAELHRIAEQRGAYEKDLLNNAAIQQGTDLNNLSEETILLVNDLGAMWEGAAMSASKILNPVKAAKKATKEVAETAEQMVQSLIDASPVFTRMGVNVEELSSIGESVTNNLEAAFMNMSGSIEDNFKAMASAIIKDLYRVLVVQRLVSGITGALGLSAPTTSLRPVMRPIGAASGRSVTAGQQYMTGEHGRELFVPKVNGRVLSAAQTNNASSGPSGESVTVIQNNTFGSGVTRAEVSSLLPRMVEATKQAVLDEKLRGGSYGRGFG
ncbi:MAG: hypothetical protein P8P29_06910 [Flavobacteriaceae bacterium]|nr:hypothetical protein [Flavobacteriaceae bacterium]